jgi:hypothetical protein
MPKVSEEQITFCGKFTFAFKDTLQIVLFLKNIFFGAIFKKIVRNINRPPGCNLRRDHKPN